MRIRLLVTVAACLLASQTVMAADELDSPELIEFKSCSYVLHSPLTSSSVAKRNTTGCSKPVRYILMKRMDLKSLMFPTAVPLLMGILN